MLGFFSVDRCFLSRYVVVRCVWCWGGGAMMGKGRRGRGSPVISQCERTGTTCPSLNVSNCGDLAKSRPSHSSRAAAPPTKVSGTFHSEIHRSITHSSIYFTIHLFFPLLLLLSSSWHKLKTFLSLVTVRTSFSLFVHFVVADKSINPFPINACAWAQGHRSFLESQLST